MNLCIVQDEKSNLFLPLFYESHKDLHGERKKTSHTPSPYCDYLGKRNMIVSYRGRESYFPEHSGVLSIKCAFKGREFYQLGKEVFSVDDSSYLIINSGRRYSYYVSSGSEVESFCIFFSKEFNTDLIRSLILPDEKLLSDPDCSGNKDHSFFEQPFQYDYEVRNIILILKKLTEMKELSFAELEDNLHILMEYLIRKNSSVFHLIDKIPLVNRRNRVEIYKRLNIAMEFIDASLEEKLTISDIAKIACLSPHHFLRLFKNFLGMTPHQYIMKKRMERAKKILETTEIPVTEIAFELGFESLNHFSRLFNRYFGISPRLFRKNKM